MTKSDGNYATVHDEYVDVLAPPEFKPTGAIKPVADAIDEGNWLGVMSLWLVRRNGLLIYQQRPPHGWQPGKLDGSVGGYYRAGESGLDGLREAREELGWSCPPEQASLLGRHLSVGVDNLSRERRLVVTLYMAVCNIPLIDFVLDGNEVTALYEIAAHDVISTFQLPGHHIPAHGIDHLGRAIVRQVAADDFTYIFGDYHLRIAKIAKEFARGRRKCFC